jgi:hypothetical protein
VQGVGGGGVRFYLCFSSQILSFYQYNIER